MGGRLADRPTMIRLKITAPREFNFPLARQRRTVFTNTDEFIGEPHPEQTIRKVAADLPRRGAAKQVSGEQLPTFTHSLAARWQQRAGAVWVSRRHDDGRCGSRVAQIRPEPAMDTDRTGCAGRHYFIIIT